MSRRSQRSEIHREGPPGRGAARTKRVGLEKSQPGKRMTKAKPMKEGTNWYD
jgi:hypothetical protein